MEVYMKLYNESVKLAKGVSAVLCAMLIAGSMTTIRADSILSPALDIISQDYATATNGLVGTDIYFSADELALSLGVESVGKITVASLPEPTMGRLQLGQKYVEVGQTISERAIDSLKFVPFGNNELAAAFTFCRGSNLSGPVYTCMVYTTKNVNTAPVIYTDESVYTAAGTSAYSGIVHLGTIHAGDSEGDPLNFEILSYPLNGSLKLTDSARGYYEYIAAPSYEGNDSFTVCAVDKYGNRSAPAKITVHVDKPSEQEIFADMDGHWANSAVISCVRAGVIDAPASGENFFPDEYMSRAEFLALAMKSAGYSGFSVNTTGFSDDKDIPAEYKGSVAAAEALGIIDGADGYFYPNNQITRSEAAVIVSRLTGISAEGSIPVFADSDAVPAWARGALMGLCEAGILRGTGSGNINAYATVTRGAAVQMLSKIIK